MTRSGMVSCPQPEAAESGIEILRAGGNAADAAVACALAQTVVDPLMCGIAGFGTAAVYMPGSGAHEYIDFHATAPAAARPDMWADLLEGEARDGFGFFIKDRLNDIGYQSIATPGTPATALRAACRAAERRGADNGSRSRYRWGGSTATTQGPAGLSPAVPTMACSAA